MQPSHLEQKINCYNLGTLNTYSNKMKKKIIIPCENNKKKTCDTEQSVFRLDVS